MTSYCCTHALHHWAGLADPATRPWRLSSAALLENGRSSLKSHIVKRINSSLTWNMNATHWLLYYCRTDGGGVIDGMALDYARFPTQPPTTPLNRKVLQAMTG